MRRPRVRSVWIPAILLGLLVGCNSKKKTEEDTPKESAAKPNPAAANAPDDVKPIAEMLPNDTAAIAVVRVARGMKSEMLSGLTGSFKMAQEQILREGGNLVPNMDKVETVGAIVVLPPNLSKSQAGEFLSKFMGGKEDKGGKKFRDEEPFRKSDDKFGDPGPPGFPTDEKFIKSAKKDLKEGGCGEEPSDPGEALAFVSAKKAPSPPATVTKPSMVFFVRYTENMTAETLANTSERKLDPRFRKRVVTKATVAGRDVFTIEIKTNRAFKGEPEQWVSGGKTQLTNVTGNTILISPDNSLAEYLQAPRGNASFASVLEKSKDKDVFLSLTLENQKELSEMLKQMAGFAPPIGQGVDLAAAAGGLETLTLGISLQSKDPLVEMTFTARDDNATASIKAVADELKKHAEGGVEWAKQSAKDATEQLPEEARATGQSVAGKVTAALEKLVAGIKINAKGREVTIAVANPGIAELVKSTSADFEKVIKIQQETVRPLDALHNLGVAAHNYAESHNGRFPVAGKHSCLTELLPYVEQFNLHQKVKFDEAWDSKANSEIGKELIKLYNVGVKGSKTSTRIRHFSGPGTPLGDAKAIAIGGISNGDGTSSTIMFIFAGDSNSQHWMKPDGIAFDPKKPEDALKTLGPIPKRGVPVMMCDGAVRRIYPGADAKEFAKMVRYNDGETVDLRKATGDDRIKPLGPSPKGDPPIEKPAEPIPGLPEPPPPPGK